MLNGLYDAKLDKAPVLAIAGQVETDLLGSDFFQEVNLDRLFDDVAVYSQRVMSTEQLPTVVNQAIRAAYTQKGVSVLIIPDDIPKFEVEREARKTSSSFAVPEVRPSGLTRFSGGVFCGEREYSYPANHINLSS